MPQIVCNITLDVSLVDTEQTMMAKCGDSGSRLLSVRLTDNGQEISISRQAGVLLNVAYGEERRAFEGIVDERGCALFVLPTAVLAQAGEVRCDVSVVDPDGSRLTSSPLLLTVEEAVCPGDTLVEGEVGDLLSQWIASEALQDMTPAITPNGLTLRPALNRKYCVDFSDPSYIDEGTLWQYICLELPTPTDAQKDAWVLFYCHAPYHPVAGHIRIDWENSTPCRFANGGPNDITADDFDIICTYSHLGGFWQVGIVQYHQNEVLL